MLTRRRPFSAWPLALALMFMVSACSGGGGGGGASSPAPISTAPANISQADAVRLAKQASFGPTQALVDHIVALKSADAWLDEQFASSASSYAPLATRAVPTNYCSLMVSTAQGVCYRDYLSSTPVAMAFYSNGAGNPDQLRQRVAFALSQLIVASDVEVHSTAGLAVFNQIFLDNAFGNYHDILQAVTLNPYMGDYLDMANSAKSAPNENYARELMQLFSIGVVRLNADGTAQTDSTGATIPPIRRTMFTTSPARSRAGRTPGSTGRRSPTM